MPLPDQPEPVLVLVGGLGTRLRPLTATLPKALVPVLGRPFLEYLLADLARQGFRRLVLAVGHLAEQVEAHFGDGRRFGYQVSYAYEASPLGTGGAIRAALPLLEETFVALNGDTLLALDLPAMVRRHRETGAALTAAAVRVPARGRYGALRLAGGRIQSFEEKGGAGSPGFINGGVYVMSRELFREAPSGPFSLERDLFPRLAGQIVAFETSGFFVDMGTHEALEELTRSLCEFLAARGAGGEEP